MPSLADIIANIANNGSSNIQNQNLNQNKNDNQNQNQNQNQNLTSPEKVPVPVQVDIPVQIDVPIKGTSTDTSKSGDPLQSISPETIEYLKNIQVIEPTTQKSNETLTTRVSMEQLVEALVEENKTLKSANAQLALHGSVNNEAVHASSEELIADMFGLRRKGE